MSRLRQNALALGLGLTLLLSACFPVPSIHPFFTPEQEDFDSRLLGVWTGSDELRLTVSQADESGYLLTFSGDDETMRLRGTRFRIGDTDFLDLGPQSGDDESDAERIFTQHLLPVHTLYRVQLDTDKLRLDFLDEEWLDKKIKAGELTIPHTRFEGDVLLTATTPELQALLGRYARDAEAFSDFDTFTRSN